MADFLLAAMASTRLRDSRGSNSVRVALGAGRRMEGAGATVGGGAARHEAGGAPAPDYEINQET